MGSSLTWDARSAALLRLPPFSRKFVIHVARKLWLQVEEGRPASRALLFTMRRASFSVSRFSVSCLGRPRTVRNSGAFFSPATPCCWVPLHRGLSPSRETASETLTSRRRCSRWAPASRYVRLRRLPPPEPGGCPCPGLEGGPPRRSGVASRSARGEVVQHSIMAKGVVDSLSHEIMPAIAGMDQLPEEAGIRGVARFG